MTAPLALWSHALAALLFAALLVWQLRHGARSVEQRLLLGGLLLTAIWAWLLAILPGSVLTAHAETARNLLWIALLYALSGAGREASERLRGVGLVYAAVAAVLGLQLVADTLAVVVDPGRGVETLQLTAALLRVTAAAGALVLVHNLYGQAAPASRSSIRLVSLALALTWFYDLNLYTLAHLHVADEALAAARGGAVALTVPLFALGGQWREGWRLRLSRAATFQSLSLLAICSYFAVMAILATALGGSGGWWTRALAVALLAAMTVAALVVLPSPRARGWLRVKVAKHLFEHRYDYRTEWLRFAGTLGRSGAEAPPLSERIVSAFAEILEATAGLLLTADEAGQVEVAASWNWPSRLPALGAPEPLRRLWSALAGEGRVLEFDGHRHGWGHARDLAVPVPTALLEEQALWTGIPLVHGKRLVGLVLLAAPDARRPLDWEDFDLLRTAGRQAASSLAEAHGQQALMNAQRFEEFNRRFAFILHDIKNLVSQLSLLTRNAERHADNPEFRADMIATLQGSVGKMNELLARLSPQARTPDSRPLGSFSLLPLLTSAIAAKRRAHEVRLLGQATAQVVGDPAALEQALAHLLQNAVDASAPDHPVTVRVLADPDGVRIEIADRGGGMDGEFVRSRLFQPFASTKQGGFGIGAYEARALIRGMGGELGVDSQPGQGTRFTIHLPAAEPAEHRKSA
jgi:putative PEP-CTERM system histidine kinase